MDFGRLVKWVLIAAIAFFAWKYILPEIRGAAGSSRGSHASRSSDNSCVAAAGRASSAWGSGIGRFVNPPYDTDAWSSFRGDVESKISAAEGSCNGSGASDEKVRGAMRDLRSLVSDLDTSIRSGSAPPSDVVQRQNAIDQAIDDAADLVRSGK